MRDNMNKAVAHVREEVCADRLEWTYEHVQRLIKPYPPRKHCDAILQRIHEEQVPAVAGDAEDAIEAEHEQSTAGSDSEHSGGASSGATTRTSLSERGQG